MCHIVAFLKLSFIFINQISPFSFIILHCIQMMCQIREHLDNRLIRRYLNEVYVTKLTLSYVCDLTIKELRDGWELLIVITFEITLLKELHEKKICPEATNFERLSWVGDVSHVEHEFDQRLFRFSFLRLEIWVFNLTAQFSELNEMLSHVGVEHG